VVHLGLLSLSYKQHIQEEFRMDHHKNPQQNQILKSTYIWMKIIRGVAIGFTDIKLLG